MHAILLSDEGIGNLLEQMQQINEDLRILDAEEEQKIEAGQVSKESEVENESLSIDVEEEEEKEDVVEDDHESPKQ